MARQLPIITETVEDDAAQTALSAPWPEAVLQLTDEERTARVRVGIDSVILTTAQATGRSIRGFVRAILRVPLGHPKAAVYSVFVELDRSGYGALQHAFKDKVPTSVWGTLATRLPYLDDAYGARVLVLEEGTDARARVVDVDSASLRAGPAVGRVR